MSKKTAIEWTDHTFNPWWGCSRVSAGCAHCYAETLGHRFGVEWGPLAYRRPASEDQWAEPLRWNASAKRAGRRARVFCASMADVFDEVAPEHALTRLFDLTRATPWLDWQLLTKRPQNIRAALPADWCNGYRNVWLGVSVENQAAADERIPLLLQVPARVRFLSCEPLLGPVRLWWEEDGMVLGPGVQNEEERTPGSVDFPPEVLDYSYPAIDWVIAGGESGPGARPMHPDWARGLRDQCQGAGVPFFFKQWGEWAPLMAIDRITENLTVVKFSPGTFENAFSIAKLGKKAAGRLLDGREWNEFPKSTITEGR